MLTTTQINQMVKPSDPYRKIEEILENDHYYITKINEYFYVRNSINFDIIAKDINFMKCIEAAYETHNTNIVSN